MKALLVLFINSFKTIKVEIDPTTLRFYGSTEDYSYDDPKSKNIIGFSLANIEDTQKVFDEIRQLFQLNPEMCKVEDYMYLKDKFADYESDKRPRISVSFRSGSRGLTNPPSFELRPIE